MSDVGACGSADDSQAPGTDVSATLAALRARGAQRLDPVRFRLIEAMARRASAHTGDVRRLLDSKLAGLLTACDAQLARARADADEIGQRVIDEFPGAADHVHRLLADADPPGLRQLAVTLQARQRRAPLADLVRDIDRHAADGGPASVGTPTELRALRDFRSTWSQLRIDQQMTRSLAKAPGNAGPLNSHRLVLRALQAMREVAPAYLHRFVSYVDALMWLDQADLPRERPARVAPVDRPARRAKR
ncbi:MAG: DUF2894 domain-containing protein [Aquabacterium sp.]|nr:DUF2894 domain-containing protein [Aquabacterium sp.]